MIELTAAIETAKRTIGVVKEVLSSEANLEAAETRSKLADITIMVSELKLALADAQQAIRDKDAEISKLIQAHKTKADLVEIDGFKFDLDDFGNANGYAYCPKCEITNGRLVRLSDDPVVPGLTFCSVCDQSYQSSQTIQGRNSGWFGSKRPKMDWDVHDI